MKSEWEQEAERFLFDFGKHVLGKNTGGMIVKLKDRAGVSWAWNTIKLASQKSDPREYVAALLQEQKNGEDCAKVGDTIGKWRWNGSTWMEVTT